MRVFFLGIMLMHCFSFTAFSQQAKIIEVHNEVNVKIHGGSRWAKAKVDTYLGREAEIKTGTGAKCMLAFDEQLKNIVTIGENSQIRLENIQPSVLFLPRGRVFSLIEDIAKIQEFRVRTPVAIAGVRGTGDFIESTQNGTTIKCFEGKIYAQLFDYQGNGLIERTVFEGLGVHIDASGQLGEMFFLDEHDYDVWNNFRNELTDSRAERGTLPRSFYEQKPGEKVAPFKKEKSAANSTFISQSQQPQDDNRFSSQSQAERMASEEDLMDEDFDMLDTDKKFENAFGDIEQFKEQKRDDLKDSSFEQQRKTEPQDNQHIVTP